MKRVPIFEKLRKLWATASAVSLIFIALAGIAYDLIHRFGGHDLLSRLATPEQVLIMLLALLCGGLGAERILTLKKIEMDIETAQEQSTTLMNNVDRMMHDFHGLATRFGKLRTEIVADLETVEQQEEDIITAVKRINTTEALIGTKEIEAAACKLLDECGDGEKIKATGQYRTGDGLSEDYFKYVASRVARAQQNKGGMEYHVVVAAQTSKPEEVEDERIRVFKGAHIQDRLRMRTARHPWPFEVLIGGHSMIIALLGGETKAKYEIAVKITDPEFVEKAAEWYREVAWEGAEKVNISEMAASSELVRPNSP